MTTVQEYIAKALAESWQIHRRGNGDGNIIGPSLLEPQFPDTWLGGLIAAPRLRRQAIELPARLVGGAVAPKATIRMIGEIGGGPAPALQWVEPIVRQANIA